MMCGRAAVMLYQMQFNATLSNVSFLFVLQIKPSHLFLTSKFHRDVTRLMEMLLTTQHTNPTAMPLKEMAAYVSHWINCHSTTWERILSIWIIWGQSSRLWDRCMMRQLKKRKYSFKRHCWNVNCIPSFAP